MFQKIIVNGRQKQFYNIEAWIEQFVVAVAQTRGHMNK